LGDNDKGAGGRRGEKEEDFLYIIRFFSMPAGYAQPWRRRRRRRRRRGRWVRGRGIGGDFEAPPKHETRLCVSVCVFVPCCLRK
jgi:hypothetical protein